MLNLVPKKSYKTILNSPKSNEFLTLRVYPQTLGAGQTTLKAHQEQPGDSSVHCRNCRNCCCCLLLLLLLLWLWLWLWLLLLLFLLFLCCKHILSKVGQIVVSGNTSSLQCTSRNQGHQQTQSKRLYFDVEKSDYYFCICRSRSMIVYVYSCATLRISSQKGWILGHHARDFFRLHIDMDNLSLSR